MQPQTVLLKDCVGHAGGTEPWFLSVCYVLKRSKKQSFNTMKVTNSVSTYLGSIRKLRVMKILALLGAGRVVY